MSEGHLNSAISVKRYSAFSPRNNPKNVKLEGQIETERYQ